MNLIRISIWKADNRQCDVEDDWTNISELSVMATKFSHQRDHSYFLRRPALDLGSVSNLTDHLRNHSRLLVHHIHIKLIQILKIA